uniref:Uncharacterized protein n=1 Tax=Tetranychus urticae TaxID=32264 RepID=T1JWD6_TETUR
MAIRKLKVRKSLETFEILEVSPAALGYCSKLDDSYELQRFLADYRDLMSWIVSIKALVSSDELANDVTS